jgi:hypothetical protein
VFDEVNPQAFSRPDGGDRDANLITMSFIAVVMAKARTEWM